MYVLYVIYDSEFIFIYKRISRLFLGVFFMVKQYCIFYENVASKWCQRRFLSLDMCCTRYVPGLCSGINDPRESPGLHSLVLHRIFGTNSVPSSKFLWLSKTLEHPEPAQQCQESCLAGFPPRFLPLKRISGSAIIPQSWDLLLTAFFKIFSGPGQILSCYNMLWVE